MQCFGSGFFRIWIRLFFLSKDPDRPKTQIQSGKSGIGSTKKRQKTEVQKNSAYVALSALSFWVSLPQKPYQKHNIDPISLLMDGSGL